MLFRVFPLGERALPLEPGGALYVPRDRQGAGRHDNPERYGALYASRTAEAAAAERIQAFRGQELDDEDFQMRDGRHWALAALDEDLELLDLDDPRELVRRSLRPSRVATRDRAVTQHIAAGVFEEGAAGFTWWSTLEASWMNATLFAERTRERLTVRTTDLLTTAHPAVRAAADTLGVRLR
jgi:hypothetical protein